MALQLVTDAGVVKIPSAVIQTNIEATAGGLGTTGIVALIGEADLGPDFTKEEALADNAFGPDQYADVVTKYGSGDLVDAFANLVAAANDPQIQGAPATIVIVKTNAGVAATATLTKWTSGTWATIQAKKAGQPGNMMSRTVTAFSDETLPTTGGFTMLVPVDNTDIQFRVNGGAAIAYTINADDLPTDTVTGINALSGVAASGGTNRSVIVVAGTLALAVVSGMRVTITRSVNWTNNPTVGDTLYIPTGSILAGGSDVNVGSYVVTARTNTTISATKLWNTTAPAAVLATDIAAITDVQCFAPVVIKLETGDPVDGEGKSLEIAELTSAAGRLNQLAYALSTTKVTWVSTSTDPENLVSATEYVANINVTRKLDSVDEDIHAGGDVFLKLGYAGTTSSAVIAGGVMTITSVGGSNAGTVTINLADWTTVADLVAYISSLDGYTAEVGTTTLGQKPASRLDEGTFGICSKWGAPNGRIKADARALRDAFTNSPNVGLTGTLPTSGQPTTAVTTFLTGGAKGATSDTDVTSALEALQAVDVNFFVPMFSDDASVDIADGLTDSSSSYTVDGVNAASLSHALTMNTLKNYKPRQAFLSHRGTFADAKNAASTIASFLCAMTFQDARVSGQNGVVQERPWMAAVKAAGMQAAAFRRAIYNKGVNIVGAVQAAGDFNPRNASQVEAAITSGLLALTPQDGGGWKFVADQTTYGRDDNFYFNSIQAVYVGNVISRT